MLCIYIYMKVELKQCYWRQTNVGTYFFKYFHCHWIYLIIYNIHLNSVCTSFMKWITIAKTCLTFNHSIILLQFYNRENQLVSDDPIISFNSSIKLLPIFDPIFMIFRYKSANNFTPHACPKFSRIPPMDFTKMSGASIVWSEKSENRTFTYEWLLFTNVAFVDTLCWMFTRVLCLTEDSNLPRK